MDRDPSRIVAAGYDRLAVVSREREEQLEGGSAIEYLWVLARRDG